MGYQLKRFLRFVTVLLSFIRMMLAALDRPEPELAPGAASVTSSVASNEVSDDVGDKGDTTLGLCLVGDGDIVRLLTNYFIRTLYNVKSTSCPQ